MVWKCVKMFCCYGFWHIEQCPPKSNNQCFNVQKNNKHYSMTKIILIKIIINILILCYDGWWSNFSGGPCECHKFWFCHNDLNCCVGRLGEKYVVDRFHVLPMWHVQEGTNVNQNEVIMLEKTSFICE